MKSLKIIPVGSCDLNLALQYYLANLAQNIIISQTGLAAQLRVTKQLQFHEKAKNGN